MVEMKDVPSRVWRKVRDKWTATLADGEWHHNLWNGCALCEWMPNCDNCPLQDDNWCMGYGDDSRLHIAYHDDDNEAWLDDVEEFIKEISQYCEDDEDGQA